MVEFHQYSSGSAHIIDSTGQGIAIYHGSNPFPAVLGDEIEITGEVGIYRDQIQITGSTTVTTTGNTPVVPIPDWALNPLKSTYENVGKMARVIGTVTEVTAANFKVSDAIGDTILVYIDSSTGIDMISSGLISSMY